MSNIIFQIRATLTPLRDFLHRYHTIIFFSILSVLTIAAGINVLAIISDKTQAGKTTSTISSEFDKETIDRVIKLNPSDTAEPQGRTNPFVE